jgi:hypothetical protein
LFRCLRRLRRQCGRRRSETVVGRLYERSTGGEGHANSELDRWYRVGSRVGNGIIAAVVSGGDREEAE